MRKILVVLPQNFPIKEEGSNSGLANVAKSIIDYFKNDYEFSILQRVENKNYDTITYPANRLKLKLTEIQANYDLIHFHANQVMLGMIGSLISSGVLDTKKILITPHSQFNTGISTIGTEENLKALFESDSLVIGPCMEKSIIYGYNWLKSRLNFNPHLKLNDVRNPIKYESLSSDNNCRKFIAIIGRIEYSKHISESLILAINLAKRENLKIMLIASENLKKKTASDESELSKIKLLVEDNADFINWINYPISHDLVIQILSCSKYLIHFTEQETEGLVISEACSQGVIPIIRNGVNDFFDAFAIKSNSIVSLINKSFNLDPNFILRTWKYFFDFDKSMNFYRKAYDN